MSLHKMTVCQLLDGLSKKQFSSTELTQHFIQRLAQYNTQYNCMISLCEEQAMQQAEKADEKIANNTEQPLIGLPIVHKDLFCTQGIRTSCGSKMLDNFIAPYNATVVENLNNAGTIILGKTNMDEFAMGSSNENSYYGACKNPWHTDYVPGGSSGGSAVAVAAHLIPAATATDTGGSIRQPASFTSTTGIKPTYGRVSRYGMVAYASSLDQGGILCKTAQDCAILLENMASFDEKDSTSVDIAVDKYSKQLDKPLENLTIGLPKEYFADGLDADVAKIVNEAIAVYQKAGATLIDISLPNTHLAVPAYYVIASAECSSNLSRFDGVRYGYRCANPEDLTDMYQRSRSEAFSEEVKRRIMIGTYTLSEGYYDAYYIKAQKIRRLIANDFQQAFKTVEVIMSPVAPTPPFKLGAKTDDPVTMYLSDIYTVPLNLAGLPGMSIPAGFSQNLPVGLQLIGNHWQEAKLLNIAHQFQCLTDWHTNSP